MDAIGTVIRVTRVELSKLGAKRVTWIASAVLLISPIAVELGLLTVSEQEAVFPQVLSTLFAGEVLLLVAAIALVVSVMALGNDYELGTVLSTLSRGVERYQLVLAKVLATWAMALVNGVAYLSGALLASSVAHTTLSDLPLVEAAGAGLVWRALAGAAVIGLVEFAAAGFVMLALVLGRRAWLGMVAGLGCFAADFYLGALGPADLLGITGIFRATISYHALSLLERLFAPHTYLSLQQSWAQVGPAEPYEAIRFLVLYGAALTLCSALALGRQDLMSGRSA